MKKIRRMKRRIKSECCDRKIIEIYEYKFRQSAKDKEKKKPHISDKKGEREKKVDRLIHPIVSISPIHR